MSNITCTTMQVQFCSRFDMRLYLHEFANDVARAAMAVAMFAAAMFSAAMFADLFSTAGAGR